ncbi:hypothetical protein [Maridesulfovibrio frigidus]|uniref:hypothetical protein n=1 Tax=Maridesulfovibrio frigidus TaxID=340956 RepID=UPI0004E1814A|nr:hypothetical protein [Maridesulfovibrio frigidus]
MNFGFLIEKNPVSFCQFSINPLENFDQTIENFYATCRVSNGWIYNPQKQLNKNHEELQLFKQEAPKSSKPYTLPATHKITSEEPIEDDNHFKFLILGYGFLHGLYLLPEKHNYLTKTPYKVGSLHSLLLFDNDLKIGMKSLNNFYCNSSHTDQKQAFAILHWFLAGQSYQSRWDHFEAQYKVLDGIFRLSKLDAGKKHIPHSKRPFLLTEKYHVKLPSWAKTSAKPSKLGILRNELSHEAKFAGQPIGYGHPKENFHFEFPVFNMKLTCAVLGLNTPFISKLLSRDRDSWSLKL